MRGNIYTVTQHFTAKIMRKLGGKYKKKCAPCWLRNDHHSFSKLCHGTKFSYSVLLSLFDNELEISFLSLQHCLPVLVMAAFVHPLL
jgi:hypothetical protein